MYASALERVTCTICEFIQHVKYTFSEAHRCFPVNIAKFLKAAFSDTSGDCFCTSMKHGRVGAQIIF